MRTRLAATYFLIQGLAVTGWWILLALVPAARALFAPTDAPFALLGAFAPGDLALAGVGSVLVAWQRGRAWGAPLAWIVAGAMAYGAAYTMTGAALGVIPPLTAILMLPAASASLLAAAVLTHDASRNALPSRPAA